MTRRNLAAAVRKKCIDCIHDDQAAGTWLDQVILCTSYECPLWPVRPVKDGRGDRDVPVSAGLLNEYGLTEGEVQAIRKDPYKRP